MAAEWTPKAGDRALMPNGSVVRVGNKPVVWVEFSSGLKLTVDAAELRPAPTYPERWVNVYTTDLGCQHPTRQQADYYDRRNRIAVIHLAADGTVTLEPTP
jgi:hypothetical protein